MSSESTDTAIRTAVVFVHGLLERRPMDTLDSFAKTVLAPQSGGWEYYPRPVEITDSYEARRYVVPAAGVELYEYDWSFLMTSGRYAGFVPALGRVFLRRPRHVPDPLFGIWRVTWLAVLVPLAVLVGVLVVGGFLLQTGVAGWIIGLVTSVVVLSVALAVLRMAPRALIRSFLTTGFINVARYFDPAVPESHAARRAIRGGLVDLLYTLHQGRYARIVVVGHGIGGYIAYDALTTLWEETHELRAAPDESGCGLGALGRLEAAADRLSAEPDADDALDAFRAEQFDLWRDLRAQGNPWRITDFVTVGTPMALADLFIGRPPMLSGLTGTDARRHELFDRLTRRGVVVRCPPRSEALPADAVEAGPADYGVDASGATVLGAQSPFAVTRWTNIWFPVRRGSIRGDWFGGVLRPLFGPGIREIAVSGNLPQRLRPGAPQTGYFTQPDRDAPGDVAFHLREVLALDDHSGLDVSVSAPEPDPATVGRVVYRSWQRSM
ncbi:hypothetical protein [Mycobacterium sp. shizuoka-1]|uniref:hypothetical protein n=1 Tax=Mycobacterium sp. shizuoka-1 TaxID=2039281 RepID=UPI000C0623DE|nr:hypothetical protein [Mycobacterium sp. shizuoka-1]GAY15395.1 hypothetical protein MSZK_21210 [Mycobacterium sp. shizuoka-1]